MDKDPRFDDVVYRIEATDFEQLSLWKENNDFPEGHHMKVKWEQDCLGFWREIGHIAGHPVCISCSFTKLNGKRIVFYNATSMVVDYAMVEEWINKQCPEGTHKTDPMNFGHCINFIKR